MAEPPEVPPPPPPGLRDTVGQSTQVRPLIFLFCTVALLSKDTKLLNCLLCARNYRNNLSGC